MKTWVTILASSFSTTLLTSFSKAWRTNSETESQRNPKNKSGDRRTATPTTNALIFIQIRQSQTKNVKELEEKNHVEILVVVQSNVPRKDQSDQGIKIMARMSAKDVAEKLGVNYVVASGLVTLLNERGQAPLLDKVFHESGRGKPNGTKMLTKGTDAADRAICDDAEFVLRSIRVKLGNISSDISRIADHVATSCPIELKSFIKS